MKAGKFKSVRAALEAGIVRPTAIVYTDDPAAAGRKLTWLFTREQLGELIGSIRRQMEQESTDGDGGPD